MAYNKERLRWQCRRGMLELDILLEDFLDSQFEQLPVTEQEVFSRLLAQPDPVLIAWIIGNQISDYAPFADLIERIKAPANQA